MKFFVGDSIDSVLRKDIDLFEDTTCETGTSLFWKQNTEALHDYLKLVGSLTRCKLMKERMPLRRVSLCLCVTGY
jgi:hypothetical protein